MRWLLVILLTLSASLANAQTNGAQTNGTQTNGAQTNGAQTNNAPAVPASNDQPAGWKASVKVTDGLSEAGVANAVVFLRAARPKGPFEPTDPEPAQEWTAVTNADGTAVFQGLPDTLASSGLRLHAASTYHGLTFKSAAVPPSNSLHLDIAVYEKGIDLSGLKFESVRTVVEPWEGYLVITQFYMLTNTSKVALDLGLLPGEEFERGIPIRLPTKAKGIRASGSGQTTVIDSFVYWKGTLNPAEKVPIQISFSMAIHSPDFVYEQDFEYDVNNLEILIPLQTRFPKLPRLDGVTLAAPGFKMESGKGLFGMRDDMEFIGGTGKAAKKGDTLRFKMQGLPYHRSWVPFVVLGFALLTALFVGLMGRREARRVQGAGGLEDLKAALELERNELLDQLVQLRVELKSQSITQDEHDTLMVGLQERLALILKKLSTVNDPA